MGYPIEVDINSFVIRITYEKDQYHWYGYALHVQTKQSCYFSTFAELEVFIRKLSFLVDQQEE